MKLGLPQSCSSSYKTTKIYLLCLNAALGAFFFGYILAVLNPTQRYIKSHVFPDISKCVVCFMTSFTPLGSAFGALIAGSLASQYGRRKAMIITDLFAIVGVVLTTITNEYVLLTGRLITGVCVGLNSSLVPLYISEMSPVELKGFTGSFYQIFLSIGINSAYILGLKIPTEQENITSDWWRFMLCFPIFAPLIRFLVLSIFFRHETPKFLMIKGNEEKAISALSFTHKEEYIQPALNSIKENLAYHRIQGQETYQDLLSPKLKQRFIIGCLLAIFQQACGNNVFITYSSEIFNMEAVGHSEYTHRLCTIVIGLLHLSSAFIAFFFIRTTGRRTLFIIGTSILSASLFLLSMTGFLTTESHNSLEWFLFLYVIGFGISLGPLTSLYLAEILPSIGIGFAMFLCWMTCFGLLQAFPFMTEGMGYPGTFLIFSGICILGLGFITACVKETRNKSPLEIAEMFEKKVKYRDESEEKKLLENEDS